MSTGSQFKKLKDFLLKPTTPRESPKKIPLKSVNSTIATKQNKVLIHGMKLTCDVFKIIENK